MFTFLLDLILAVLSALITAVSSAIFVLFQANLLYIVLLGFLYFVFCLHGCLLEIITCKKSAFSPRLRRRRVILPLIFSLSYFYFTLNYYLEIALYFLLRKFTCFFYFADNGIVGVNWTVKQSTAVAPNETPEFPNPYQEWIDFMYDIVYYIESYFPWIIYLFQVLIAFLAIPVIALKIIKETLFPKTPIVLRSSNYSPNYSANYVFRAGRFNCQSTRDFHSTPIFYSGLDRHNTHSSVPVTPRALDSKYPWWDPEAGNPMPEAQLFYIDLPPIHASNFLEILYITLQFVNNPSYGITQISIIIEARLEGNRYRTVAPSFRLGPNFTLNELSNFLTERILNFEAQSGSGEEGPSVIDCRALITNISSAPEPQAQPFTSSPANVQWSRDIKADRKAARRPSATIQSISNLQSQIDSQFNDLNSTMSSGLKEVVNALKTQPSSPSQSTNFNWAPLVQGLVSGLATSLGANISFPTSAVSQPAEAQVSPSMASPKIEALQTHIANLETKIGNLESTILTLTQSQLQLAETTTTQISDLIQNMNILVDIIANIQNKKNG